MKKVGMLKSDYLFTLSAIGLYFFFASRALFAVQLLLHIHKFHIEYESAFGGMTPPAPLSP